MPESYKVIIAYDSTPILKMLDRLEQFSRLGINGNSSPEKMAKAESLLVEMDEIIRPNRRLSFTEV